MPDDNGMVSGERNIKIHGSWLIIVVGEINGWNLGIRMGRFGFRHRSD